MVSAPFEMVQMAPPSVCPAAYLCGPARPFTRTPAITPVARSARNIQQAAYNTQHATGSVQPATEHTQHATDNLQQTTCSTTLAERRRHGTRRTPRRPTLSTFVRGTDLARCGDVPVLAHATGRYAARRGTARPAAGSARSDDEARRAAAESKWLRELERVRPMLRLGAEDSVDLVQREHLCSGEPGPGADVAGVSPVPAQMWQV